jgi:hypothetical protein
MHLFLKNALFLFLLCVCNTNAFAQWDTLPIPNNGTPQMVQQYRDKLILFLADGKTYNSQDTGRTWQAGYDFNAIMGQYKSDYFSNDTLLFAKTATTNYRSTDGGLTWQTNTLPADAFVIGASGRHCIASNYSTQYISHNNGLTWQTHTDSLFGTVQSRSVGVHQGVFYTFGSNPLDKFRSSNSGFNWQRIPDFVDTSLNPSRFSFQSLYNKFLVFFSPSMDFINYYTSFDNQLNAWTLGESLTVSNNAVLFSAPDYHTIFKNKIYGGAFLQYSTDTMRTSWVDFELRPPYQSSQILTSFYYKNYIFALNVDNTTQTRTLIYRSIYPFSPLNLTTQNSNRKSIASTITLNWIDADSSETSYIVERKTGVGGWSVVANLPRNSQTYTDVSASQNTNYQYRVKAKNTFGSSAYSNTSSLMTDVESNNMIDNKIVIFPNPTQNGMIYILEAAFIPKNITVTDALGRTLMVYTKELPPFIDLSTYPDGIYFIRADVKTIRIVKNK